MALAATGPASARVRDGEGAEGGMTPTAIAKIRLVTAVATSPDGSRVAHLVSVPRIPFVEEDGPAYSELHILRADGRVAPYISGQVNISDIAWTPDGSAVSHLAKRGKDEKTSIYAIPHDGGEARKVLSFDTDVTSHAWSPDGRRLAFLAREPTPKEIEDRRKKGFTQEIYEESLQPTKVWVASVGEDGTVSGKPKALDLPGSASELRWSPKGDRLAVALAPTPTVDDGYMFRRVHVVDAETGAILAKIENPGKLGQVSWSPDGTLIAMVSGADIHDTSEGRLMVAPATGGAPRDLIPGYAGHVKGIAWRDAETLIYLADEGVESTIGEISASGGSPRTLLAPGRLVVSGFDVAGGAAAMTGETPSHPAELHVAKLGEPGAAIEPKRATNSNPWLKDVRLAVQEVVTHKARDGLELQGVLIRPLDEKPGQRYPLILSVHGGPEAHVSNGWLTGYSNPGQLAAAHGFAVFYPNYRGSTGRGVEFAKLSQGDPAGKEFDDLVDAVDHLIEIGLVDKDKVGVTGGSYGGYATAWCSTRYSERFAAGVMFVGISDKISKTGTTDIPNEEYLVHARKRPWENWMGMLERSPIYHAEKGRTPLLILHGKEDPRVFPGQSMEIYRFLKTLGNAPTRLVFYPGEGHGNRRAASRLDYNLRMLQWMKHYLQGPGGEMPAMELDYPDFAKDAS